MSWLSAAAFLWLTALGPSGPVGTLGLELEGSAMGVGTLGLELESGPRAAASRTGSQGRGPGGSQTVGTLGLELESAPEPSQQPRRRSHDFKQPRSIQPAPASGSLELELE